MALMKIVSLICAVLWATTFSVQAMTVSGRAEIVDGDTIVIGRQTIRIFGIDAPEAGQRCNRADGTTWRCDQTIMDRLDAMLGSTVTCKGDGFDDFDRLLAVCGSQDVSDIGAALVQEGHAWAFVRYSQDYVAEQDKARSARLGIWQGENETPWDYRARRWEVAEQEAPEGCPIKGNISSNGRIYHPPWSPWYTRTKITPEKGERWFCSEREALDAGWRAPRWR
jgi:endonuclease YncB( thermonuclease family)